MICTKTESMAKVCDKCGAPSRRSFRNFDLRYCPRCWRNKDAEFGKRVCHVGSIRMVGDYPDCGSIWNAFEDLPAAVIDPT
jgi:hypothetical protein